MQDDNEILDNYIQFIDYVNTNYQNMNQNENEQIDQNINEVNDLMEQFEKARKGILRSSKEEG